ncbi:MAG: hypothetical protein ABFS08_10430 [Pseudomonadota bacterium]
MSEINCETCGRSIDGKAAVCPHCGVRRRRGISRVWVLAFFVMGILMGLLFLILQQGESPSWLEFDRSEKVALEDVDQIAGEATRPQSKPRPRPQLEPKSHMGSKPHTPQATSVEPMLCDRKAAQAVRDKARSLATISEQGGILMLRLGRAWEYYSPGHRRSFVQAFADADLCLQGQARAISFSFRGEKVAMVNAEGAVEMR